MEQSKSQICAITLLTYIIIILFHGANDLHDNANSFPNYNTDTFVSGIFFIIIYIYTVHSSKTNNWRQNYRHIGPITRNKKSEHWCIFICPFPTPALSRMQFWKRNALCRGFANLFIPTSSHPTNTTSTSDLYHIH